MKEQFCTYEIASKLKELGFDEPCLGLYRLIDFEPVFNITSDCRFSTSQEKTRHIHGESAIMAPLYQQALSFLLNILSKEDTLYLINCSFYSDNSGFIRNDETIEIPFDSLEKCVLKLINYARRISVF